MGDTHRMVGASGAGLSDGEILEVNEVTAYFAYANRTASGLGVSTLGDVLGLSPADSAEDDWHPGQARHSPCGLVAHGSPGT